MIELLGYAGIILVNLAYVPQLYKTIKLKKASQISGLFYASILGGIFCYLLYALSRNDPVFIISNSIGSFQPILMLYLSWKWRAD